MEPALVLEEGASVLESADTSTTYLVFSDLEAEFAQTSHDHVHESLSGETIEQRLEHLREQNAVFGVKRMDCVKDGDRERDRDSAAEFFASFPSPSEAIRTATLFSELVDDVGEGTSMGALPTAEEVEDLQKKIEKISRKHSGKPKIQPNRELEDIQATAAFVQKEILNGEEDPDILQFWSGCGNAKKKEEQTTEAATYSAIVVDETEPEDVELANVRTQERGIMTQVNTSSLNFDHFVTTAGQDDFLTTDELVDLMSNLDVEN